MNGQTIRRLPNGGQAQSNTAKAWIEANDATPAMQADLRKIVILEAPAHGRAGAAPARAVAEKTSKGWKGGSIRLPRVGSLVFALVYWRCDGRSGAAEERF